MKPQPPTVSNIEAFALNAIGIGLVGLLGLRLLLGLIRSGSGFAG